MSIMWWKTKEPAKDRQRRPQILIIEDDLNNHPLFQEVFGAVGFDVTIRQTADGDFVNDVITAAPDIISMDIMIGKDGTAVEREGLEAAKLLKSDERTKNIPIMMLTNFSEEHKVIRAKEIGAADFISLQGHTIREIPLIFLRYLENPMAYTPTNPHFRV